MRPTRTKIAFAALSAFAALAIAPATANAIVNGTVAQQPYTAGSLQLERNGDPNAHHCGVWLYDNKHVATAAHCVADPPGQLSPASREMYGDWVDKQRASGVTFSDPSVYHVRLNSVDRTTGGEVYKITKIVVHESWAWGVKDPQGRVGDVALLTLDHKAPRVGTATLAPQRQQLVREVGWGADTDDAKEPPKLLHELDVPILDKSGCETSTAAPIGTDEHCFGNPPGGGGACYGDSGTAAFQYLTIGSGRIWAAVGSASRPGVPSTVPCSQRPTIYANVDHYRAWFKAKAEAA